MHISITPLYKRTYRENKEITFIKKRLILETAQKGSECLIDFLEDPLVPSLKQMILREMADCRSKTGKVQNKPGTSCCQKAKSAQALTGTRQKDTEDRLKGQYKHHKD